MKLLKILTLFSTVTSPIFASQQEVLGTKKLQLLEKGWLDVVTLSALPQYTLRLKKPNLCDTSVDQFSGYLDISDTKHFFFWFFEARNDPDNAPVVLWLNGGPGCSSFTGLLMELGPCRVKEDGSDVEYNPYSWNKNANIIFLDQPMNVGYSYGDKVNDSAAASEDVYAFLQLFFNKFPKFSKSPFHVFGESYGGHYVPEIARTILEKNSVFMTLSEEFKKVHLDSIGIGNGLVDPLVQYDYYSKMACDSTYGAVLDQETCDQMDAKLPTCTNLIKQCYQHQNSLLCVPAELYCNQQIIGPYSQSGMNPYDVRRKCGDSRLCYEITDGIEVYLNKPEVMQELGAEVDQFNSCDTSVYWGFLLSGDWMKPYVNDIPLLLENELRVLVYAGDADFICNWYGNKAWTTELKWTGQFGFQNTNDTIWRNSETDEKAGEVRTFDNFTFLRVFGAGHMVPYDQPSNALNMLDTWLQGKEF